MRKRVVAVLSAVLVFLLAISAFLLIQWFADPFSQSSGKNQFYVGVTYCGNSTVEADQLIDKVKSYTNLFVVQSGPLEQDFNSMEQICDYAVNSGLNVIAYYGGSLDTSNVSALLGVAPVRWGSHFLGVYDGDEPGGKMLDSSIDLNGDSKAPGEVLTSQFTNTSQSQTIFKSDGTIDIVTANFTGQSIQRVTLQLNITVYSSNGTITHQAGSSPLDNATFLQISDFLANGTLISLPGFETLTYQPSGAVQDQNGTIVTNWGDISQFEPYKQLWDSRPLQTYDQAAAAFVSAQQTATSWLHSQYSVKAFTSDYGLYWFDYLGGYDVVLTELCGNQTDAQALALARGAADLQGKSWGAMLTWQYGSAPYLSSGDEMYNEMCEAYAEGARYVALFNYSPNNNGSGLLQPEHFAALQKFWTDVVQNQKISKVTAQAALVLPSNYGWGMRNPNDTIWGLWQPDAKSQQVWLALQSALAKDGAKLDVVYDSSAFPVSGEYQQVYYWNQTN